MAESRGMARIIGRAASRAMPAERIFLSAAGQ
jgi:hypothetical protein